MDMVVLVGWGIVWGGKTRRSLGECWVGMVHAPIPPTHLPTTPTHSLSPYAHHRFANTLSLPSVNLSFSFRTPSTS